MDVGASSREIFAEIGGTALLMFVGLMAETQAITSPNGYLGNPQSVAVAWGIVVMVACYRFGHISGAHINPAVTIALALARRFPWHKVIPYCLAQFTGAFIASWLVRGLTIPLINRFDPGLTFHSQATMSTLPGDNVPIPYAFFNEVAGTAILILALLTLLDQATEHEMMAKLEPALIGIVVTGIGLSLGSLSGWAINPARDLPPRIVQALTGYASAWQDQTGETYWWVPVLGPIAGAALAVGLHSMPEWLYPPAKKLKEHDANDNLFAAPTGLRPPPDYTTDRMTPPWAGSPHAKALSQLIPPELMWKGEEGRREAVRLVQMFEAGHWTGWGARDHVLPQPMLNGHPVPMNRPYVER